MTGLNETHDPARKSWLGSANDPASDFPIQNLPYGVFSEGGGARRIGVAIGDMILDLTALEAAGILTPGGTVRVFDQGVLIPLMGLPPEVWSETRARISDLPDAHSLRMATRSISPAGARAVTASGLAIAPGRFCRRAVSGRSDARMLQPCPGVARSAGPGPGVSA